MAPNDDTSSVRARAAGGRDAGSRARGGSHGICTVQKDRVNAHLLAFARGEIPRRPLEDERARHGEAKEASRTSLDDISSGRRGGLRSHRGSGGPTYDQLRNEAKARGIRGRSRMNKAQLEKVLSR